MSPELETQVVNIISFAGDAKSHALAAIQEAKEGNFEEAKKELKASEESLQKAHENHTDILFLDAKGELPFSFLLIHASNHLSEAELALTFSEEIVTLYERRKD